MISIVYYSGEQDPVQTRCFDQDSSDSTHVPGSQETQATLLGTQAGQDTLQGDTANG